MTILATHWSIKNPTLGIRKFITLEKVYSPFKYAASFYSESAEIKKMYKHYMLLVGIVLVGFFFTTKHISPPPLGLYYGTNVIGKKV